MLKQKKSKSIKMRGTNSHGWGHKKKHRGAGHRGGKGLSGTGARGDAQKAGLMSNSKGILMKIAAGKGVKLKTLQHNYAHFGKQGFKSINKTKAKTLSLNYIESNFDKMIAQGLIVQEGKEYVFDSNAAGYNKILGRGKFTKKLKIICEEISEAAKQRVFEAGGVVEALYSDDFEENSEK